jgi:hypothetical protein
MVGVPRPVVSGHHLSFRLFKGVFAKVSDLPHPRGLLGDTVIARAITRKSWNVSTLWWSLKEAVASAGVEAVGPSNCRPQRGRRLLIALIATARLSSR